MTEPTNIERVRIEQSNEVAGIVFDEVKKVWPDLHPVLDLRYGIADAVWAAGLRQVGPPIVSDAMIQKVREAIFAQSQRERGAVSGSGLYYPSIDAAINILRAAGVVTEKQDEG